MMWDSFLALATQYGLPIAMSTIAVYALVKLYLSTTKALIASYDKRLEEQASLYERMLRLYERWAEEQKGGTA